MFDLHLHLPDQCSSSEYMPKAWYGLVCTSKVGEWQELVAMTQDRANMTGAVGILPEGLSERSLDDSLAELERVLKSNEALQIGEVGLDRRFHAMVPMERQQEFLSGVLELGWQMNRSVSLHVVRAEEPLFMTLEKHGGKLPRLLWHGYTAGVGTAGRFIKLGGTLSLGPSLWRPGLRLAGRLNELRDCPFAVETDWPGGWLPEEWRNLAYPEILRRHMARLAMAMDITIDRLEERTYAIGTFFTHQPTSRR